MQARQQINNAQMQAQNQASQIEGDLVAGFRDQLSPLAEKIAKEKGASAVLASDSYLFWFDPAADITDELAPECPVHLLGPGETVIQAIQMDLDRARLWHAELYRELRAENARLATVD